MILLLIRHGRSLSNEKQLVTGDVHDALSPYGVTQCQELRGWMHDVAIRPDIFLTSQWRRAQETSYLLWPDNEWLVDKSIGETNAGDVKNLKLDKFLEKYPDFYSSPINCYPEGESHQQLNDRVIKWLKNFLASTSRSDVVAMVTHSGPISCILQHVVNISMQHFPSFLPINASVSVVEFPENTFNGSKIRFFSVVPKKAIANEFLHLL